MSAMGDLERPQGHAVFDYLRSSHLILVTLLGFGLLVVVAAIATRVTEPAADNAPLFAGAEVTPPRSLPALALERTDRSAWSSDDTQGRLSLFFFGYTHCPDVCPLTLSHARQIYQQLGADTANVDVYFVTVDPERDTPERLGRYVSQFNPDFIALTGSDDQLESAKASFGVVAVRQPGSSAAGYSVDHTASSYLVDREGKIRLIYAPDASSDDVVDDIQALLEE